MELEQGLPQLQRGETAFGGRDIMRLGYPVRCRRRDSKCDFADLHPCAPCVPGLDPYGAERIG